ncbi:30S ribosomal protein S17 [candidate division WWE3 bacterium]|nr:30S ribosomal protein S17 [candidate division WWE3 bacterium]
MKRRLIGTVISDKMNQTVVVEVEVVKEHPLYKKKMLRRKKYHVHNAENKAVIGNIVEFEECRPISKTKSWQVISIKEVA